MKNKRWIILLCALATLLLSVGCQGNQTTSTESKQDKTAFTGKYMVDASYVKEHLKDENVILVDARGEEAARKGTIEGAITTTWQNLSNMENVKKGEYDWAVILEPSALSKKLGELGLSKDKEIILFAEGPKGWGEDGRILWTLRAAGYDNAKMVDGGLSALQAAGLPKSNEVKKPTPVEVQIDPLDRTHVINTKELEGSYKDYKLVDVREDKEFNGEILYGEAKGGRLPDAIQVKFTDLFHADGTLLSNEEITAQFEDKGIKKTDRVVAYCTSGIRSAYTQLVLEMLGYEHTKNYEGSYNTWAVHHDVEK